MQEKVYWSTCHAAGKAMHLAMTAKGICLLTLPNESFATLLDWTKKYAPDAELVEDEERLAPFVQQFAAYLAGVQTEFEAALDLRGTPFQLAVWKQLLQIPYGVTKTYSEIATAAGYPHAVRAVGAAIGATPVPLLIPCHRAVGKNGKLTGYRGGLEMKAELLQMEGSLTGSLASPNARPHSLPEHTMQEKGFCNEKS